MKRIAAAIIDKRAVFVGVFIILIIFSLFSSFWVKVENDFTVYLPDSAEAKRGLDLMNDEFITYATADIMVKNVTPEEAQDICDGLTALNGVYMVAFDQTEDHYKNGSAMYSVSFDGAAESESAQAGLANVKAYLSDRTYYLYSDSFSTIAAILAKEMSVILVIVVIVVVGVLLFTSTSFVEPAVMLLTFIVAAVINLGTNFLMGTISFVSNSVAIVMQLALSVDYAIIYCNRYKQEHETKSIRDAAVDALAISIPEIAASSLTTIAGLTAMTFMQFRLGFDMGICLIKAILLSLLSVFLFMPALLLLFGKAMDKTKHKSFVPKISFVGRFAYRTRILLPIVFVGVLVFSYISFSHTDYAYYTDLVETKHKNEEDIAYDNIYGTFGKNNLVVVIFPNDDFAAEKKMAEDFLACDEVNSVLSLATYEAMDGYCLGDLITYREFMDIADVDELTAKALFAYYAADADEMEKAAQDLSGYSVPLIDLFLTIHDIADTGDFALTEEEKELSGMESMELTQEQKDMVNDLYGQLSKAQDQLQGRSYNRMLLYMNLTEQSDETFAFLDKLHVIGQKYYDEGICLTGNAVSTKDFADTFEGDIKIVGILSIGLVMLILLLTFRSLGMPLLLIAVIQGSIWLNFSIAVWSHTHVFFMCYLIVSAIQMGANIDYAIVISSRYNELRDTGLDKREAMIRTIDFSFPTVITSGSMMIVAGLLIGRLVSDTVIAGMGHYVGTGTAISVFLVNFALPQILIAGDGFSRATKLKVKRIALPRRVLSDGGTILLAAGILFSGLALPRSIAVSKEERETRIAGYRQELSAIDVYKATLNSMTEDELQELKFRYAKSLLSYEVADEKITDGKEQLSDGEQTLNDAKKQLADGEQQYADGLQQYNDGWAAYEAGQAQLAEGQARYDAGVAQLEEAKKTYEEGQQQLTATEPIYNMVLPLYQDYLDLQNQYDEAVASGDRENAVSLGLRLAAAKSLYETTIFSTGYSMTGLIAAYEDGQVQLAEGARQIAEAEAQLADAKAQLDAGYAQTEAARDQLAAAEQQLAASRKMLDDGAIEISQGERTLNSSKKELEAGEEIRDGFAEDMEEAEADLKAQAADGEAMMTAVREYRENAEIAALLGDSTDDATVLSAAGEYYQQELDAAQRHVGTVGYVLLGVGLLLALCTLGACYLRPDRSVTLPGYGSVLCTGAGLAFQPVDGSRPAFAAAFVLGGVVLLFLLLHSLSKSEAQ